MGFRVGGRGPVFRRGGALLLGGALSLLLPLLPTPLDAQAAEWNHPRVLGLIEEARQLRQSFTTDSTLRSYKAQARGYVYFFLDREDTGERILVKTDQIALEVYWRAPNLTRQRIVGLRDEKTLPTNIHYHLDHLVVVQDEFGDRIRIGDGDEVEAVVHPAAPGSGRLYDFLLADSITLTLQGGAETIRVYEVQVRPKDFDEPGFVGSVFLDRDTRAIVRMSFTFTPASYVDDYLDHISISLENGLWLDRHWLPFRQELEIRREIPFLDIPAGSVIRGWFDIRDYEFNPPLPPSLFRGATVTTLPESARRAFPFEDSLHAQLDREGLEGLRPPPSMEEIRAQALRLTRDRYLSGLRRLRLYSPQPTISSALRFNRAEGLFLGGGFSYGVTPSLGLTLHGGYSMGRGRPALRGTLFGGERHPRTSLSVFWNQPLEVGSLPAISGALNTLAALTLDEDYTDLFFASGLRASHSWTTPEGNGLTAAVRWEEHRSPRDVVSDQEGDLRFRPVLPMDEGRQTSLALTTSWGTPWPDLRLEGGLSWGLFRDRSFGRLSGALTYGRQWRTRGLEARGDLRGGILLGGPPRQSLFLLGGRETVPGYPFRSRVGEGFWLLRGEMSREVAGPWLKVRAFGAAGGTRYGGDPLPPPWPQDDGSSLLLSAGLGLGIGWDVMRLDVARGLRTGGEWEVVLSVNHDFWPWL